MRTGATHSSKTSDMFSFLLFLLSLFSLFLFSPKQLGLKVESFRSAMSSRSVTSLWSLLTPQDISKRWNARRKWMMQRLPSEEGGLTVCHSRRKGWNGDGQVLHSHVIMKCDAPNSQTALSWPQSWASPAIILGLVNVGGVEKASVKPDSSMDDTDSKLRENSTRSVGDRMIPSLGQRCCRLKVFFGILANWFAMWNHYEPSDNDWKTWIACKVLKGPQQTMTYFCEGQFKPSLSTTWTQRTNRGVNSAFGERGCNSCENRHSIIVEPRDCPFSTTSHFM